MAVAELSQAHAVQRDSHIVKLRFWMGRLIIGTALLMLMGLGTVYTTTVFLRIALGRAPYADFIQHIIFLLLGTALGCCAIAALNILTPAKRWLRWLIPISFIVSLVLVALVQVPSLGVEAFGSKRFLQLGPITFQPSELLKVSLVLYLSQLLCWWRRYQRPQTQLEQRRALALGQTQPSTLLSWLRITRTERPQWPDLPKRCGLVVALGVGLTVIQPDLGTALLILGASVITMMLAGVNWQQLLLFLALLAILGGSAMLVDQSKYDYAMQRIHTWLNPLADDDSAGYQITQARGALAVGGVWGRGYLQSQQKINRLPLSTKDFVYPVMVEELGYIGGVVIILLFLNIAWIGLRMSQYCRDPFNRTVIAALGYALCLQGFVNIAVSIGTLPLSGLTLPFFSEGGTSVVVSTLTISLMLGLALSEIRQARHAPRRSSATA